MYDSSMNADNEYMLALTHQEPLRACRKCGRRPTFFRNTMWWKGPPEEREPYAVQYQVICQYCGNAGNSLGSPEGAIHAWQMRNDPSAAPKYSPVPSISRVQINYGYVTLGATAALFIFVLVYHFMVA